MLFVSVFFFQAEDGIRDLVRSRGLGDVYKRQIISSRWPLAGCEWPLVGWLKSSIDSNLSILVN